VLGASTGSFHLLLTLVLSLFLGIVYSTEHSFLRWKQTPILAVTCILAVRAIIVQWGFFGHFNIGNLNDGLPAQLSFSMCFMGIYSIVIALLKDAPDIVGDMRSNVQTLSVKFGVQSVTRICVLMLVFDYASGAWVGWNYYAGLRRLVLSCGHLLSAAVISIKYCHTNVRSSQSIFSLYMFVWKMFYCEYVLFAFL